MCLSVFFWCTSFCIFKDPVKGLLVMVAGFYGNIDDIHVRALQKIYGVVNPQGVQIGWKADSQYIRKDTGEGVFPYAKFFRKQGQGDFFLKIVSNVSDNFAGEIQGGYFQNH